MEELDVQQTNKLSMENVIVLRDMKEIPLMSVLKLGVDKMKN